MAVKHGGVQKGSFSSIGHPGNIFMVREDYFYRWSRILNAVTYEIIRYGTINLIAALSA
jgi:hypothetical protein